MKKGGKIDNMKFSTEHRAQLLTEALKFSKRFAEKKEFLVSGLEKLSVAVNSQNYINLWIVTSSNIGGTI